MRQPYQAPRLVIAGSISDLTQANLSGPQPDNLTTITVVIGGVTVSIPGQGVFS